MKLKNKKGVTLVDVVMAIFIITVFVSINVALFYNAYLNSQLAIRRDRANQIVINKLEGIKVTEFNEVIPQEQFFIDSNRK